MRQAIGKMKQFGKFALVVSSLSGTHMQWEFKKEGQCGESKSTKLGIRKLVSAVWDLPQVVFASLGFHFTFARV